MGINNIKVNNTTVSTVDSYPVRNSDNLISSKGVYKAMEQELYWIETPQTTFDIEFIAKTGSAKITFSTISNRFIFRLAFPNGANQWIKAPLLGENTFDVPRTYHLAANCSTWEVEIVANNEMDNHINLFCSVNNSIESSYGIIADLWLRKDQLSYIRPKVEWFELSSGVTYTQGYENGESYVNIHAANLEHFGRIHYDRDSISWCIADSSDFHIMRTQMLIINMQTFHIYVVGHSEYRPFFRVLFYSPNGHVVNGEGLIADLLRSNDLYFLKDTVANADMSGFDALPSYYDSYMQQKISEVNKLEFQLSSTADEFVFLTDLHARNNQMQSPSMIREIMKNTCCDKLITGGDYIWAYTESASTTLAECPNLIIKDFERYKQKFVKNCTAFGKMYDCRGNHDFTIRISGTDHGIKENLGYTFGHDMAFHNIVGRNVSQTGVTFNPNDNGCYYFFDNPKSKTRYLVCDGQSKTPLVGNYAWGLDSAMGISDTQLVWFRQNAFLTLPNGWNVVCVNHEGFVNETYPGTYATYANMYNELKSLKNSSGIYSEKNVGHIVTFCGHWHTTVQTFKDNILHIQTAADTLDTDVTFLNGNIYRTRNTTSEQLFDLVLTDFQNNIIRLKRFGGGFDRIFHLNKISLTVGQTYTLTPELTPAEYTSYDSNGTSWSAGWTLSNTVISNTNGTVTALKTGEANAAVKDASGNNEFWYISVS